MVQSWKRTSVVRNNNHECFFFVKLLVVFFLLLPELVIVVMGCWVKELTLEVPSRLFLMENSCLCLWIQLSPGSLFSTFCNWVYYCIWIDVDKGILMTLICYVPIHDLVVWVEMEVEQRLMKVSPLTSILLPCTHTSKVSIISLLHCTCCTILVLCSKQSLASFHRCCIQHSISIIYLWIT